MAAPERPLSTAKQRAALLGLLTIGLVMAASFVQLHEWLVSFLPATESIIRSQPILGATLFVLFAAVSAMLAFVSSAIIVPVGVFAWGKFATMLLLLAGWTLGGACAYMISRSLGRAAVRTLVPPPTLAHYESRISERMPFGLVLLFQLALPSEVPAYLLGLVRYHFGKYLCALVVAEMPYAVATVYLGAGFIERRFALMAGVGVLLLVFSALTLHLLNRRFRQYDRRPPAPASIGQGRSQDRNQDR